MKNIFLVIVTVIILTSCSSNQTESISTTTNHDESIIQLNDAQIKNAGIVIGRLERKTIATVLKVNGKIDVPPQNMVSISVPLGGYLKSTQLLPGMKVKKGEPIAIMEDQQYIQIQQEYLISKSGLLFLEKEYNRQKDLNESKATSDKVFQQTEADYTAQKIKTKSLYEKLKLIGISPESLNENNISRSVNVYSPIDGYVSKVDVNIGKYLNPADVLFELVNPTDIHLNLTVYEKDIDKLFVGQKLVAYNNHTDKKYNCEILLISQDLSKDRSAEVHCHFENYDKNLIPGMYMNAEIEVQSKDAVVVMEDAVVNFENKNYVFIQESGNTFKMQEVEIGYTENGFIEIISGSSLTEKRIVVKGAYSLLMGLKNKAEE